MIDIFLVLETICPLLNTPIVYETLPYLQPNEFLINFCWHRREPCTKSIYSISIEVLTEFLICCLSLLTVAIFSSLSPYRSVSKLTVAVVASGPTDRARPMDAATDAMNFPRPPIDPPEEEASGPTVMARLRIRFEMAPIGFRPKKAREGREEGSWVRTVNRARFHGGRRCRA